MCNKKCFIRHSAMLGVGFGKVLLRFSGVQSGAGADAFKKLKNEIVAQP